MQNKTSLQNGISVSNQKGKQTRDDLGTGCGAVGRAVASDTRHLQFKFSLRQYYLLSTVLINSIEKTKIMKKDREWLN